MTELVTYERDERIATITMDDGKVNAFSIPMLEAVHAAFDQAERDGAIVVLPAARATSPPGFDLKVFAGGDVGQVIEMLTLGATLAERILGFATPVIAACPGHTVAAGAFMALAADMRIGIDGPYRIGLNEVKIGLTVPWFVIELARQRLNPAHFNRAVISATMYGPAEAITAGFLDEVVPADELRAASLAAAATLAELNPQAHTATKLRARGDSLKAIRAAIETELTPEGLGAAQPPA